MIALELALVSPIGPTPFRLFTLSVCMSIAITRAIPYHQRMGLFRARLTSFFVGFGLASGLALYQLRQDVSQSHAEILESVGAQTQVV